VEFVQGAETASLLRYGKSIESLTKAQLKNFANGPGKLCQAMGITREQNQVDLCKMDFFITDKIDGIENQSFEVETSPRIGIDYAEEAKDFPWRFLLK